MTYGYFDNANKEYVITRPDTPSPWINYLGSGRFSGIISNNAGGLTFDSDPGSFRITRYNFNHLPVDRPGRYLYFKDMESGCTWSPTWQPLRKALDFYETRHGMGYTTISARKNGIESAITYFIPLDAQFEIWSARVKNTGDRPVQLKIFSYVEFSCYIAKYDIEANWSRYFMDARRVDNAIVFNPSDDFIDEERLLSYLATDLPVESHDCQRDAFVGRYRDESDPIAVERGYCSNTDINADFACGSFCCPLQLAPGEEKTFVFTIGNAANLEEIRRQAAQAADPQYVAMQLQALRDYWQDNRECLQVHTPDEAVNTMLNIWHPYQCRTTFNWARGMSYYQRGSGRWGYRDSVQDVLGVVHSVPAEVKEKLKIMMQIQNPDGSCRASYYPGKKTSDGGGRSDDQLWTVFSVCTYLKETGDFAFLQETLPFTDGSTGTVWQHLKAGMEFTRTHVGEHGIPLFLHCDWNDSISKISKEKNKAESAFVFFQAAHAAWELIALFTHLNDAENLAWAKEYYAWCQNTFPVLWDGKWFLRGFTDYGEKFGTDEDEWNKIFLNPQSWAVLSRLPSAAQGNSAFDEVENRLFCDYGVISHAPASTGIDIRKKFFFGEKAGVRENGGIFFHASTWAIIAECLLGRKEQAFSLYHRELPTMRNDNVDLHLIEPYVYASSMIGPAHEKYGTGSESWLSGTAAWMYLAAAQYILGIRPDYAGLCINPQIPDAWDGFTATRKCRGTAVHITVKKGQEKGLFADGTKLEGNIVPYEMLHAKQQVEVVCVY